MWVNDHSARLLKLKLDPVNTDLIRRRDRRMNKPYPLAIREKRP
jgi:hypothetical protein